MTLTSEEGGVVCVNQFSFCDKLPVSFDVGLLSADILDVVGYFCLQSLGFDLMECGQVRRPLVYVPSQYSVAATTASSSYLEVGEGVGMKRKRDVEDTDATSVDELRVCLLNTCISKLTTASRLRRRRALRHTVLISNLLRSLDHAADRPPGDELTRCRARVTARRRSSDTHPVATTSGSCESMMMSTADELSTSSEQLSVVEKQQTSSPSLEHLPSPWQLQQQPELLPSCDVDNNNEVMSSPTATFCPLLPVDLSSGLLTSLSNVDASQSILELETQDADVSCDFSSCDSDVDFFESPTFHKAAALESDSDIRTHLLLTVF